MAFKSQSIMNKSQFSIYNMKDTKISTSKIIFTFLASLVGFFSWGQENIELKIEWLPSVNAKLNGKSYVIPKIKDQGYDGNLPSFFWSKEIEASTNYTFTLSQFTTEDCPADDKSFLFESNAEIPSVFNPEIVIRNSGNQTFAVVSAFPYLKEGETFKRISSVSVILTPNGKKPKPIASKAFVTQSVLREGSGTWYKISLTEDGIYKIDKEFLEACGISTTGLNPNHINIFGNGEGMLPESNSVYRTDDLAKNAIKIVGDQDGSFDAGDYILFYGFGPYRWSANGTAEFQRKMNTYSDVSVYFINVNGNDTPKRIQDVNSSTSTVNHNATQMDFRVAYEKETTNLVKGGQRWYGDLFDVELSKTFNFNVPNVGTSLVNYKLAIAGNSSSTSDNFVTRVNGTIVDDTAIPYVGNGGDYSRKIRSFTSAPNVSLSVNMTANRSNPKTVTYLDYLIINARRDLVFYGNQMGFRDLTSVGPSNISKFTIQNSSSTNFVWDITDRHTPKNVLGNLVGSNFEFVLATDTIKEFVACNGQGYLIPTRVASVAYQNLHALPQVDYVIVSHPSFLAEANRLKTLHEIKEQAFM